MRDPVSEQGVALISQGKCPECQTGTLAPAVIIDRTYDPYGVWECQECSVGFQLTEDDPNL